ncbi:NAD(P)/FAD-dependent oxidoreductase [Thermodesulfobacteriota bacterium]
MKSRYDMVVVGAGPSGLMAARTAAEKGLAVALLDRNSELAPVKRGCAMVLLTLNEPYFGEEKISLDSESGRLSFRTNGFSVPYEGPSRDLFAWHLLSPGGGVLQFGDAAAGRLAGQQARTSAVHDKGLLLAGLLRECEALGVTVMAGANVAGAEKRGDEVWVACSGGEEVAAPLVIAADGANSRLAECLGMNADRTCYGLMKIQGAELRGVEHFDPGTFYSFLSGRENPSYSVLVAMPDGEAGHFQAFTVVFDPRDDAGRALDGLLADSRFAPHFRRGRVVRTTAAVEKMYSSMDKPYRDRVLFIGDAAWCQEIEITAALMCGRHAGNAAAAALGEGNVSREGLGSYLAWWDRACLGTHDYRDYLRNYALGFLMSNADIDYLLGQVQEMLPAIFNPYRAFDLLGRSLAGSMERIARERPDIAAKLQRFSGEPLEVLMEKPMRAAGKIL